MENVNLNQANNSLHAGVMVELITFFKHLNPTCVVEEKEGAIEVVI